MIEDPVYRRWKRQRPDFPGVAKCAELLGRRNVQGSLVDIVCGELQENASSHAAELIAAFQATTDGSFQVAMKAARAITINCEISS